MSGLAESLGANKHSPRLLLGFHGRRPALQCMYCFLCNHTSSKPKMSRVRI